MARGRLPGAGHANHRRQHAPWIESWIHMLQGKKGADHQSRSGEQYHCHGKFGTHKKTAQTITLGSLAGPMFSFLEGVTEIYGGRSPGWGHTERQAGKQRDAKCKQDDVAI